jgi:2-keto-3-deoxy-6-phosphogluconate aldolase
LGFIKTKGRTRAVVHLGLTKIEITLRAVVHLGFIKTVCRTKVDVQLFI